MTLIPRILITIGAVTLISSSLHAHPGHGPDGGGDGLIHYVTSPGHLVGLVALAGAAVLIAYGVASARNRRRPSHSSLEA